MRAIRHGSHGDPHKIVVVRAGKGLQPSAPLEYMAPKNQVMQVDFAMLNEKRGKGRPPVDSEAINLRLTRELLDALDDLRRLEQDLPTRPEMIRRMMIKFLEDIEKNRKS